MENNADKQSTKPNWMPLTLAQLDFWEEFTLNPLQPVSTVAHCLEMQGNINQTALEAAITQTIKETDVLALHFGFPQQDGVLQQYCDPEYMPVLQLIDLQQQPESYAVAMEKMQMDITAKLDLLNQPLAAVWLVKLSETRYLWYIRGHHIIFDGYTMMLIEMRCAKLYAHYVGKGDKGMPFHKFSAYLAEEQVYQKSEDFKRDKLFWQDYLKSKIALPVLQKGCDDYAADSLHAEHKMSAFFVKELQALSVKLDKGDADILLALSIAYMYHRLPKKFIDGVDILPIWLPFTSRWSNISAYTPALIVNILPIFVTVDKEESLGDFIQRLLQEVQIQRKHGRYRIEQIGFDNGLIKNTRYFFSPLINVLPFDVPEFDGCSVAHQVLASGPGDGFNLTYRSNSDGSNLMLSLDADASMYQSNMFDAYHQGLLKFLKTAVKETALTQKLCQLMVD